MKMTRVDTSNRFEDRHSMSKVKVRKVVSEAIVREAFLLIDIGVECLHNGIVLVIYMISCHLLSTCSSLFASTTPLSVRRCNWANLNCQVEVRIKLYIEKAPHIVPIPTA